MWKYIAGKILRNRLTLLTIIGIITLILGYFGYSGYQMSYVYAKMLPESDSTYIEYMHTKKIFGEESNVFFIGFKDSTFFELNKFNEWSKLGDRIKNTDGIINILSASHAISLKKNKTKHQFDTIPVFYRNIESQEKLDSMKKIFFSLPFYKDKLYNKKSNIYTLAISMSKDYLDSKKRIKLVGDIKQIVDQYAEKYNIKLYYSGLPYIRTQISKKIKSELKIFILLAVLVCSIILFAFFKSLKVVGFSLLVVGIGIVWSLGFMALFSYEVTILTAMIPTLLIVIGIPNSIFLLNKYIVEYQNHGNKIKSLQRVIYKVGNAIFLTNLTTASGFATFILTDSQILKEFGIIASMSIISVFFLALILIPIIFSFLTPPKIKNSKHLDSKIMLKFVDYLILWTVKFRKTVYLITIVIVIIATWGISLIDTTGYMVDDIPKDDPIYVDLKVLEKNFDGVLPLQIIVDTKKKKGLMKLSTLKKIEKLQKKLASYPDLSKSLSIVDGIKFVTQSYYNGNPSKYRLPNNMDKNFILSYAPKGLGHNKTLNSFLDSTQQIAKISLMIKDIGTKEMKKLQPIIENEIDSILPNKKFNTILTGPSIIFFKGTNYLIKNLFISLLLAIIIISFFMSFMFRSYRMVIISILPNLIPLLTTAAIMGFIGIPIKPSTILVFSIAFGISVDDTIHYLAKYRQELNHNNWDIKKSVLAALKETGTSMVHTSIVLFFGFLIFVASGFGGTVALGALVSTTLFVAMLTNLVLLPSLLLSLEKSITTKAFKEPMIQIFNEEEDIDLNLLKIQPKEK